MIFRYAIALICFGLLGWSGLSASAQSSETGPRAALQKYSRPSVIPFPANDPYSAAKADLGRKLFFDPILSGSKDQSCASCHQPSLSWGDGLPLAIGDDHAPMSRRSPTLLNLAWLPLLGWSGSFKDIEAVGFVAITGAANMNLSESQALRRLKSSRDYVHAFADAFGGTGITHDTVEAALATYERTIVSGTAPFDRWVAGDENAVDASAKRGFALFDGPAGCSGCHAGWSFTDGSYHDIGVDQGHDLGRGAMFPSSVKLRHAFKTPTLRDVALRGPYMHDGSVRTLEGVIDLYDHGGIDRPSRSELIEPLGLSSVQKADLIAFLKSLTADTPPSTETAPRLPQ